MMLGGIIPKTEGEPQRHRGTEEKFKKSREIDF
jgi:hypothetical protein